MLSKLDFGSCYIYSVRGTSEYSRRTRAEIRDPLKAGNRDVIRRAADRIAQYSREGRFCDLFGPAVTLVPVPGSAPRVTNGLWVPLWICEELHARGLGIVVEAAVSRVAAVKKSAFQRGPDRPTLQQHYDSMAGDWLASPAERVVVVDDVVTSGCTMLAAASRASEAFGDVPVHGFAVARAQSDGDVQEVKGPCLGEIRPRGDRTVRRP